MVTRLLVLAMALGCGKSRKSEAPAKDSVAKPAVSPINTAEARRRYAEQELTSGDMIARGTGADATVLEIKSITLGCSRENLLPIAKSQRQALKDRGYTKLKCIDADAEVSISEPEPMVQTPPPVAAPRGTIDARHTLAKKLRGTGFTVRTTGPDERVLELTSASEGCKASDLNFAVTSVGLSMVGAGFAKIKCIGSNAFVDLLDERGAPIAAAGISAIRLFSDYEENEISADDKYKGKVIRVSGKVAKIGKDILDTPYVEFAATAVFGVQCMFDDAGALTSLKKGQELTVRCKGDGKLGNVILRGCMIDK